MEQKTYDEVEKTMNTYSAPNPEKIKTNPFFFKCVEKEMFNISSIEDFLVKVKREQMPLGKLLRGDYRRGLKKRIITKSIKQWMDEFIDAKNVADEVIEADQEEKPIEMKRIKVGTLFGMTLCTIIVFVLAFGNGAWFTSTIDSFFINFIQGFYASSHEAIPSIALLVGIYSSIAAWAMIGLYRSVLSNYFKMFKKRKKKEAAMRVQISTDFQRKSKKTFKYYKRACRKSNISAIPPLPIEETGIVGVNFEDIQELNNDYKRSTIAIKKKKGLLSFLRFTTLWATRLSVLTVIGYGLYKVVLNLISGA